LSQETLGVPTTASHRAFVLSGQGHYHQHVCSASHNRVRGWPIQNEAM